MHKDYLNGLLICDKPAGIMSSYVVTGVKMRTPRGTKVGHAGTLDSFATGVLILLIGKATRQCERIMDLPKTYLATFKLGATTRTLDPLSPERLISDRLPDQAEISRLLPRFTGSIEQSPPDFSAVKVEGKRASDRALRGAILHLPPRTVRIEQIDLLEYKQPFLQLSIKCGRGTYVRSIARDLGHTLNVGAYVHSLRRTCVGPFRVEDAISFHQLPRDLSPDQLRPFSPPFARGL